MANELTRVDYQAEERGLVDIEQGRAVQEVQAAVIMARRFPRDIEVSRSRIKAACKRKALAESAMYEYPRGGVKVTGPSIRLAEVCAQAWGNIDFGIRELSQYGGASEVEAFCWDLETNTRQTKTFKVPHKRYTKSGSYDLTDPRDIYETVANQGARRLRACILGVIPGDVVDEAVAECDRTLKNTDQRPTSDVILSMIDQFKGFNVSVKMLEDKIGHKLNESTTRSELVKLGKIYNSLKDGMSKPEDWFGEGAGHDMAQDIETKASAFDRHLKSAGYLGDFNMNKFIDQTAENAKKSVNEIKAMALDEKDRFFKAFERWRSVQFGNDKPQEKKGKKETPAPSENTEQEGPESDPNDLYQSDEWNELMALQGQYPDIYKEHIAGASFTLKSIRSVQMAIDKMNSMVADSDKGNVDPGDDIPY